MANHLEDLIIEWGLQPFLRRFVLDGNVDKSQRCAAQSLVFAENERQIAAYMGIGDRNGDERLCPNVFFDIRSRDETDPDICGYEALQQFAGVEFHGEVRLQAALMK